MLRRARYLPLVAAVATLGWVAAPALSVQPYVPAAEDFQQALPSVERVQRPAAKAHASGTDGHDHDGHGDAHRGEGPVTHSSGVIESPKRFDLVGLAGEMRPYELRARSAAGGWSDWVQAADGNPVYFGGADAVRVRTRGFRPSGQLGYVNITGTGTATDRLLNGLRSAVNGAVVSVASIVHPPAEAAPRRPRFVSRNAWGANRSNGGCEPRRRADRGQVRAVVIHHTVTATNYSEREAPGIVLGICRYHRNVNGWDDIGYNALTDRFGNLYVGRAGGIRRAVVGAHAQGFNAQTSGIAVMGDYSSTPITAAATRALARFVAWKTYNHGIPIRGRTTLRSAGGTHSKYPAGREITPRRLFGHRRVNHTACPGDALRRQIRNVRRRAVAIRQRSRDPEQEPTERR
jgi:hypothetical protein